MVHGGRRGGGGAGRVAPWGICLGWKELTPITRKCKCTMNAFSVAAAWQPRANICGIMGWGGGGIHLCDAGQFCALPSAAAASCCRRSHLPAENILNNKNASKMVVRPPVIWKLVSAEGLANIDISEIGQ